MPEQLLVRPVPSGQVEEAGARIGDQSQVGALGELQQSAARVAAPQHLSQLAPSGDVAAEVTQQARGIHCYLTRHIGGTVRVVGRRDVLLHQRNHFLQTTCAKEQNWVLLTKCGPKRFLLTKCGPYNISVVPAYFVGIIIT